MSNIVLIGYRGVGKSSIAKRLAQKLWWEVVSTDELIEKKVGSLSSYIEKNGWDAFREVETEILSSLTGEGLIIDCGGGVVEQQENHDVIKKLGQVYWLKAPVTDIKQWIGDSGSRPALSHDAVDEVQNVLSKRTPLYAALADSQVWTDQGIEQAVDQIKHVHLGPRVALSLAPSTVEEAQSLLIEHESFPLVELRLDGIEDLSPDSLKELIDLRREHLIVTNRHGDEGGILAQDEEQRLSFLSQAIDHGVAYVDIELRCGVNEIKKFCANKKATQIICSHHDFKGFPENLEELYSQLKDTGADIVKLAVTGSSSSDIQHMNALLSQAKEEKVKLIGLVMGKHGTLSRLTSHLYGGWIASYVSVDSSTSTAPGQLTFETSQDLFSRFVSGLYSTKDRYGVVGDPISHSLSPVFQETALFDSGKDADYVRYHVATEELPLFIEGLRVFGVKGINVTIPHKENIMQYLDEIDETAQKIGAVNTIVNTDGKLIGYNTDWIGAVACLEHHGSLENKTVTLVGAGGAAKAIAYGLSIKKAKVTIVNRTEQKAQKLASLYDFTSEPLEKLSSLSGDILINSTSLGLHEKETVSADAVSKHNIIFDCVYSKTQTPLVKEAEKHSKQVVDGKCMLASQGAASFELWNSQRPHIPRLIEVIS